MIIGVDPGGLTGLVLYRGPGTRIYHAQLPFEEAVQWLATEVPAADLVAVERFTIAGRTLSGTRAGANDATQMIGACRALCVLHGVKFTLQSPADAKNAFNDRVLKDISVYSDVTGGHARDALRHALLAERRFPGLTEEK